MYTQTIKTMIDMSGETIKLKRKKFKLSKFKYRARNLSNMTLKVMVFIIGLRRWPTRRYVWFVAAPSIPDASLCRRM